MRSSLDRLQKLLEKPPPQVDPTWGLHLSPDRAKPRYDQWEHLLDKFMLDNGEDWREITIFKFWHGGSNRINEWLYLFPRGARVGFLRQTELPGFV